MTRTEYLQEVKKLLPPRPGCIEIGVLNGDFSSQILSELNPEVLYLIDPFETGEQKYADGFLTAYSTSGNYYTVLDRFRYHIETGVIQIVRKYSQGSAFLFDNGVFDFIYLDGSHLYEDMKSDLKDYVPKMKDNGIIGGHDYFGAYSEGVKRAVDEFCEERNFEMVILNPDGGDFALKRK